jgi:hypothetical protein
VKRAGCIPLLIFNGSKSMLYSEPRPRSDKAKQDETNGRIEIITIKIK